MIRRLFLSVFLVICTLAASAQIPEEYTITDISGWTSNQLAALPYFDRYVPLDPAGATGDFAPVARSGMGVTAGVRDPDDTMGAFVRAASQTNIAAWGTYNWSYSIWDGHDTHFYWGSVTHSPARDVNVFGQVVGYATLPGSGSGIGSSGRYGSHGYLRDAVTGEYLDLTPNAHQAELQGINDHGEITGRWWTTNVSHAVRRMADGTEYDFHSPTGSVYPTVINNYGVIAGNIITYGIPWTYSMFVSETTTNKAVLPYPPQGSPEKGVIHDINDHGIIAGEVYKGDGSEHQAVRWHKNGGTWIAEDLNELLADNPNDFLMDGAIAVNDAGHLIVKAHPDDDVIVRHTLLLTPNVFPKPSVITLDTIDLSATGAVVRAKINACNLSTTAAFQYGTNTAYGSTSSITGTFTGTAPSLVTATLSNLTPHTTYHYRGSATNSQGSTDGVNATFTTHYDYATWAAEQFGTNAANPAIAGATANPDGDTTLNLAEYAFGGMAMVPDSPARIIPAITTGNFEISYTRPIDRAGITYTVECATDLAGPWQSGPAYVETVSITANPDGTETVTARCVAPLSTQSRQFLRIRIAQTP